MTERQATRRAAKGTLDNAVTLACPKFVWQTTTFPDSSELYWGCFLTQVSPEDFAIGVRTCGMSRWQFSAVRARSYGDLPWTKTHSLL